MGHHHATLGWLRRRKQAARGNSLTSEYASEPAMAHENQDPVGNGRARLKLGHNHGNLGLRPGGCR